jgi:hypothetical protein
MNGIKTTGNIYLYCVFTLLYVGTVLSIFHTSKIVGYALASLTFLVVIIFIYKFGQRDKNASQFSPELVPDYSKQNSDISVIESEQAEFVNDASAN